MTPTWKYDKNVPDAIPAQKDDLNTARSFFDGLVAYINALHLEINNVWDMLCSSTERNERLDMENQDMGRYIASIHDSDVIDPNITFLIKTIRDMQGEIYELQNRLGERRNAA